MRILGADSFVGKETSINAIPINMLNNDDICMVHISKDDSSYLNAIYYYAFVLDSGAVEDIPNVITPLDQFDINLETGEPVDSGSRWLLQNVYVKSLITDELLTNTINPATSGDISIGNSLTVGDDRITIDGQVEIESDLADPPLVVNSDVMVENLNVEYLGGMNTDFYLKNDNNQLLIPVGIDELDVYMTYPMPDAPNYNVMVEICNITDADPSIYGYVITGKEEDHFTIRFSGVIDTANYILHYFLIGDIDHQVPPSGGF
ncbi:MAG: hypothetical protein KAS32_13335 [Candidatus Peribacteraceae bacterium]|nr:hypothetical protein [Candidatus Peribacteraceae bacterium]